MSKLTLDDVRDRLEEIMQSRSAGWEDYLLCDMMPALISDIDNSEYSISDAASYLGLSGCQVSVLVKDGVIPSFLVEIQAEVVNMSQRRIRYADLKAYKKNMEILSDV